MRPKQAAEATMEDLALVDANAMKRLARGEMSALSVIYDRHNAAIRRFIAHATAGAHDVDDIVHATFLTATKAAPSFDCSLHCRPWLIGIAARLLRRRRRTLARWSRALHELTIRQASAQTDPNRDIGARDDLNALLAALSRLSEAKREVLFLAEVEGMSCEGIAQALGVPVGTIWTRLHHARRELRGRLQRTRA
jgi:RNA polymerase sigma factor (sigma-70 family)